MGRARQASLARGEKPGESIVPSPHPGSGGLSPLASEAAEMVEFVWPEELPQHLSVSQANTHETCPEQYRLSYICRIKAPPKGYLVVGDADHKTAAENYAQKIQTAHDLPLNQVRDLFAHHLDEAIEEVNGEIEWEDLGDRNGAQKTGLAMAEAYHTVAAPRVSPVAVERKIEVEIPGVAVPVIGYVDVETSEYGLERKTTSRKVSAPQPQWESQGRFYSLAIGKPMRWHVSTRTKTPAVYTPDEEPGLVLQRDEREEAFWQAWLRQKAIQILTDYLTYGPDNPWPMTRFRRQNACGWCGYRFAGKCAAWGGRA